MKSIRNFKISIKLIMAFTIMVILNVVIGMVGVKNIGALHSDMDKIYEEVINPLKASNEITQTVSKVQVDLRKLVNSTTLTEKQNYYDQIAANEKPIEQYLVGYSEFFSKQGETNLSREIDETYAKYQETLNKIKESAMTSNGKTISISTTKEMEEANEQMKNIINKLDDVKLENAEKIIDTNHLRAKQTILYMEVGGIIAIVVAVGLAIVLTRLIKKPIKKLVDLSGEVAMGNFEVSLDQGTQEEIGILSKSFDVMIGEISHVLEDIYRAADEVTAGSGQVSDASVALSTGATEQASTIEELNASMTEIALQTQKNAEYATKTSDLTATVKLSAQKGNKQMKEMLEAMEEINTAASSISKIIKVIEDIAFQTNILALNAAVEAARAGQHGKGFAVVAEEVRSLAAKSANAAKETTMMIESSIAKAETGTKIADEAAEAFNGIVMNLDDIVKLTAQMATACNEQAASIKQIDGGIEEVAAVVENNSATAEQSAAASQELYAQAQALKQLVGKFRIRK